MLDKQSILAKHFTGEATEEEQSQVAQFKQEQPQEYALLEQLWQKNGQLKVRDYDSSQAWQKVRRAAAPTPVVPMYRRLVRIAAAAAILFFCTFLMGKFFLQSSSEMLVAESGEHSIEVILADGSKVQLNRNSSLSYPAEFAADHRSLNLQGEAFFEVTKDPTKPFRIQTNHSTVEVLGTSFNVDANAEQTEIAVRTGKVEVSSTTNKQSVILERDQSAIAKQNEVRAFATVDKNYAAWKTGNFTFNSTSITSVIADLNTFYTDKIALKNPSAECLLTSNFNQNSLEEVMEIIKLSCDLKIEKAGDTYEVH